MRLFFVGLLILLGGWIAYPFIIPPQPPGDGIAIHVDKALNRLYLYEQGQLTRSFPIATGKAPELTPEGDFQIVVKEADPQGLGKEDVFGTRWMGINARGHDDGLKYGIHGTNDPDSIGRHASAGCIRLSKLDVEQLYEVVPIGTPVRIRAGSFVHRQLTDLFKPNDQQG